MAVMALLVIAYNSVYFKKLDEVKAGASKDFDAKSYARKYFDNKLTPAHGLDLLVEQIYIKICIYLNI